MLQIYRMMFEDLNKETTRVWIYASDRILTEEEQKYIKEKLIEFTKEWNTHGSKLTSGVEILHDRFVILAVDESKVQASGCSIDNSIHIMKNLEKELGINFFNRLMVWIKKETEWKFIHFSEIQQYPDWLFFDISISSLSVLLDKWND